MSEQFTKPYEAQASYGSSAVNNRVRPGGSLGSNQYYYTTNAKTGEIAVYKWQPDPGTQGTGDGLKIGAIPQGGNFNVESAADGTPLASSSEILHYADKKNIGRARSQALQIARKEWDGRTQPPPTQAIYGTNAINAAYDPAGSVTQANSLKNNTAAGQNPSSSAGQGPTAVSQNPVQANSSNPSRGRRGGGSSGGALVYPSALRTSSQDYVKIQELEYAPKAQDSSNLSGFGDRKAKDRRTVGDPIILPIPGGIQDASQVSWGQDKMSPTEAALANMAEGGIEGGVEGAIGELEKTMGAATGSAEDVREALKKTIAGAASGTGAQLLTRTTGQIMNPNMELLFKDPSLRQFNFSWKLSARSRSEAMTIIKVISTFKKGMAATKSPSNLFLKSPNTWQITYMHKGSEHKFINKIKECAMTSFTTAYTPDGNYATFEDGVMTAYQITLGLQELEPVFSNDYGSNSEIGY